MEDIHPNAGGTKRLKKGKEEHQENIEDLKVLFAAPKRNCSIKKLHAKLRRIMSSEKKYLPGLEAKMLALLHEDEDKEFKNDDTRERKKNFFEWSKQWKESDDGYETLKRLKTEAINQGISLCNMVHDIMALEKLSKVKAKDIQELEASKKEGSLEKLQVLANSLKWVREGEKTVVIRMLIDVLDASKEIKKTKLNEVDEENLKREPGVIDKTLILLLHAILELELFWSYRRLPSLMTNLKDEFRSMEADIRKCQKAMKKARSNVGFLVYVAIAFFRDGYIEMIEGAEYNAMHEKIERMWIQI